LNKQRREFIKQVAVMGIGTQIPSAGFAGLEDKTGRGPEGYTFLFQGDSITDGNRTRNNDWNHVMGHGYQYIIAAELGCDYPARQFRFFNRGNSGDKVSDLSARWQQDTLDLKPDLLSILVGINDVNAFIRGNEQYSSENYRKVYTSLLETTRQVFPDIELVLCEPFILYVGKVINKWTDYLRLVKEKQEIVRELARRFSAIHVPFQSAFDKALSRAPADHWIWDGIHLMPAGHELMAREWLQRVNRRVKISRL